MASPARLMPPVTSVSPDWYFFGVRPKCAPTALDDVNRAGSSMAEVKVRATMAPTPGTVISRRQIAFVRTIASTWRCRTLNSTRKASREADIAAELIRHGTDVHAFNQRSVDGILAMIRMVGAIVG